MSSKRLIVRHPEKAPKARLRHLDDTDGDFIPIENQNAVTGQPDAVELDWQAYLKPIGSFGLNLAEVL